MVGVARDHLEAVGHGAGEGVLAVDGDGRVLVVGQVRDFGDHGQLAHAVLKVERCGPVGGLVFGHLAGCAGATKQIVGGGVEGECWDTLSNFSRVLHHGSSKKLTASTVNGVQVRARHTRTNQGIDTSVARDAVALKSP